ncbi:transcription factor RCBF2 [Oryza sativa Japonica Group]|uniref:Dehydration-responsive element-binding protein 1F n=6 Tax=Oryza TaxID=4527 RepID=DRE1F_ORYSJ|nr:dehydration-responsive element-binding protein 1F [Oryza sativa Japonica Group]XP_052140672.1 dehydration-responsive element-binding protein 1F [Oryza glaberrima]A2WZI4.1 RecName: Full=Dehydration-responsive element-binding protein 1F; Short=Protein DREB1F; AltName: Full=Protein C-repeat-binding factor 2; Short=rCBF2 [Oryza sativa Indica Group]Q8S9Z5.1 RecName: Full=Dehydration-responsive element-binding protein 1F; Short=Protein DREB1F; AltName: Full=Protein C-repeat-binding factor 2; Short=|eukprot:NP_001045521.1 Os01g0968800 [Oryza sativa Japonica Group]
MDTEDTSSASSSSVSPPSSPGGGHHHRLPPKRRAGRKKFRETRHPVYRGVRARAGGSRWVCEVREPQAQARIWLGTYPTPEMAARAHDVAAIALRGERGAELNFPDSPSTLPRARTASPEDIRLAAAQAAELYRRPPPPLALPEDPQEGTSGGGATATSGRPAAVFVDEDAIFDMPGLIDDMARGMMLTPPAIGRSLDDWAAIDDDDDHYHMDYKLWMD